MAQRRADQADQAWEADRRAHDALPDGGEPVHVGHTVRRADTGELSRPRIARSGRPWLPRRVRRRLGGGLSRRR
ncbi:hypothetical protein P3H15_31130 [Rhodococcus sp. T2V]|uniref:hypothetical protein n=1 Tax=Rhodococcus sp. T2V TaxID=3034164 RepID=UPI0023E13F66|nr:hypothetical protein [Rhodococcus sp. T2V]MDF3309473.1 hypothetical protein [Rhodococcus sp. T2V]